MRVAIAQDGGAKPIPPHRIIIDVVMGKRQEHRAAPPVPAVTVLPPAVCAAAVMPTRDRGTRGNLGASRGVAEYQPMSRCPNVRERVQRVAFASDRSRSEKCGSTAEVVRATEMRRVKAVASPMEMASAVAPTVAAASVAAASAHRRARQHGRQNNNGNSGSQFWHGTLPPPLSKFGATRKDANMTQRFRCRAFEPEIDAFDFVIAESLARSASADAPRRIRGVSYERRPYSAGTIFPGLKIFCGSSAAFSARIASRGFRPEFGDQVFLLPSRPQPYPPLGNTFTLSATAYWLR